MWEEIVMGKKGIEDMISELEIFIDNCKYQPLSSSKIIVPKEELSLMLKELRLKMPSEIERCQKIMRNKDAIIEDAKAEGNKIIDDARQQAAAMVNEHVITTTAQEQAEVIRNQAKADCDAMLMQAKADANAMVETASFEASDLRTSAMNYSTGIIYDIENMLRKTMEEENSRYQSFFNSMEGLYNSISSNRQELEAQLRVMSGMEMEEAAVAQETTEE